MSRHRSGHSYSHRIKRVCADTFRISWTVDFYYRGQRCRFSRRFYRETDQRGAERFAKKWNLEMPA